MRNYLVCALICSVSAIKLRAGVDEKESRPDDYMLLGLDEKETRPDDYMLLQVDEKESRPEDYMLVQQKDDDQTEFTDGKPYKHKVPENYSPGSFWLKEWERIPHDELMNNLIKNYAKEGKDKETGKPNGVFFVDEQAAEKVSEPFVKKYMKLEGPKYDTYMKDNF